jgi:hypothetical protein
MAGSLEIQALRIGMARYRFFADCMRMAKSHREPFRFVHARPAVQRNEQTDIPIVLGATEVAGHIAIYQYLCS